MAHAVDGDFWTPSFDITKREDGTILMVQKDAPLEALPTIADYLDQWADRAPDRTFLARRGEDGEWVRLTYGESRDKALRLGSAFLEIGLGPDRPLLILSENSLEHAFAGWPVHTSASLLRPFLRLIHWFQPITRSLKIL